MRRNSTASSACSTRLSSGDVSIMQKSLEELLTRPVYVLQCPVTVERAAAIANSFQDPEFVKAIEFLDSNEETKKHTSSFKTAGISFPLADPICFVKIICPPPKGHSSWHGHGYSKFYNSPAGSGIRFNRTPSDAAFAFINLLTEQERTELSDWARGCLKLNQEIGITSSTFGAVTKLCTTAGQLHRIVPECFNLVPPNKRSAFANQNKCSSMPDGYFNLDAVHLALMNSTIGKFMLLPPCGEDRSNQLSAYAEMTWTNVR